MVLPGDIGAGDWGVGGDDMARHQLETELAEIQEVI